MNLPMYVAVWYLLLAAGILLQLLLLLYSWERCSRTGIVVGLILMITYTLLLHPWRGFVGEGAAEQVFGLRLDYYLAWAWAVISICMLVSCPMIFYFRKQGVENFRLWKPIYSIESTKVD